MISQLDFTDVRNLSEMHPFIFPMFPAALSEVPFHYDTEHIRRLFTAGFPAHVAVHEVSPLISIPEKYTMPHVHEDSDEINLIISKENLVYRIQLGKEECRVSSNTSIWIPRGILHAANAESGHGYFVTIRI